MHPKRKLGFFFFFFFFFLILILGLNRDEFGVIHLRFVWLEEWKSGRIKNSGRMEKWEDRKFFNFSYFCLVRSEKVSWYKLLIYSC